MYIPNKEIILKEHVLPVIVGGKETYNVSLESVFKRAGKEHKVKGQRAIVALIDRGNDVEMPSVSLSTLGMMSSADIGAAMVTLADTIKDASPKMRKQVVNYINDILGDKKDGEQH